MTSLPVAAVTAAALYVGTNIDDVVVLALLSAASRASGRPRRWEIWAGQYAGYAVLVGLSLAAGRGLALIAAGWLWVLALLPLTLGVVTLALTIRKVRRGERPAPPSAGGMPGVAGLAFVDGADGVAAYTPVFATSDGGDITVMIAVFAVGVAVWCAVGALLVRYQRITDIMSRYGHWILPAAFILIGLYTLEETVGLG